METVKNTVAENLSGGNKIVSEENKFTLDQVPTQDGKVAVVTGGSEGIGFALLHTLLAKGARKVYVVSAQEKAASAAEQALADDLDEDAVSRMQWIQCDMTNFKRVSEVAEQIKSESDRLDILVNNAGRGIMTYQLANGIDRHMALNHFSHVILTSHLLPLLKDTAGKGNIVRIVNQASNAHQGAPSDTKFESLAELNQDLGPNPLYGRSKLAGILYARYLARHLTSAHPNILVNASHPGVVSTKMSTEDIHEPYPKLGYIMSKGLELFKKDAFEGCLSALFAATKTTKSGEYICPPAIPEPGSKLSQDEQLGEQLMKLTREVIIEKTKSQSVDKGCPVDDIALH